MNGSNAITRTLEHELLALLQKPREHNNVILVEGPRQVGKTTLIQTVLAQANIPFSEFNLERQPALTEKIDRCDSFADFAELVRMVMQFRSGDRRILFIDEAQESKHLGRYVRFMKEDWQHTQVILSGSTMARIFRNARYPVGRVSYVEVQPFSFTEFLRAAGQSILDERLRTLTPEDSFSEVIHERVLQFFDDYLEIGGLPEVVMRYCAKSDWQQLREDLLYGYYQDFQRIYGEERSTYFKAVLKTAAHVLGAPFKNSHVGALLDGGNNQRIIEATSQLEAWKMIRTVEQHGPVPEKHFLPKRYLFDGGIAKQLRESALPRLALLHTLDASQRQPVGGLIENVVANVLRSTRRELTGWKKAVSGSEVDFVIRVNDHAIPVECKAALAIKNTHLTGVQDFMRLYHSPIGVIVGLAPIELRVLAGGARVLILPAYAVDHVETLVQALM